MTDRRSQETITLFDNEDTPSSQLPASRFPDRADRYVCDICGRDVTRKLHREHAHSGPIIGPTRFTCACGARYLSGMTEWDHLHPFMRRSQLRLLMLASVLVLPLALFSVLARAAWHLQIKLPFVVCCVAGALSLPFAAFGIAMLFDVYSILASIWRTRFAKSDVHD